MARVFVLAALFAVLASALSGCGSLIKTAPPPVPTVNLDDPGTSNNPSSTQEASFSGNSDSPSRGGVVASGVITPADEANLTTASGGKVALVNVKTGDIVSAGQQLLTLEGNEKLAAAVEAANFEVLSAEQSLELLNSNAALERADAQLRLARALKALDDAQRIRNYRNYRNGSDSSIETARADFILASDAFERAQTNYNGVAGNSEDDINRAGALSALAAARKARDRSLANLNYLLAMPNELEVGEAEAELQAALAEAESAKEAYEKLKDGPDPDEWALAEARLRNARAQLTAAQSALDDVTLTAPFDGTIANVDIHAGEWAAPGQGLMTLVALNHMRVETTDLSERDVPRIAVGMPASVYIEALDAIVTGRVTEISPLADMLGGDVVYRTTVELDEVPEGLRAGMTAEVSFGD